MNPSPTSPTNTPRTSGDQSLRRVEIVISILLRVGVAVSLLLIVAGTVISFVRHPLYVSSPEELAGLVNPSSTPLHSLGDVKAAIYEKPGQSIVTIGLLVLIATPMMRVGVSIVAFFLERDWVYTLITSAVFCLLMLSLALGAAE